MRRGCLTRSLGRAVSRVPGLRRVPVLKLLAVAEIALLARDHITRLDLQERQRLVESRISINFRLTLPLQPLLPRSREDDLDTERRTWRSTIRTYVMCVGLTVAVQVVR